MLKGISGGERKRTSIGYELITDPVVILLDEPTSGLDSSTALKIIKLLKKEALSGKTIICTIHQPSGQIFMEFDRLLLLHDGFQIYQGPLLETNAYLKSMNMQLKQYQNVADFVIKMTQSPGSVRFNLSIDELQNSYNMHIAPKIQRHMDQYIKRYAGFEAKFSMISTNRSVSGCKQFNELFKRNITYLFRNPITIRVTFISTAFTSLLTMILFYKVAGVDLTDDNRLTQTSQSLFNWLGLSFMLTNNMLIPACQNVVLQMPMQVPVFKREIMNHMYSPTAYFFARTLSGMLVQIISPILMTTLVFFALGVVINFDTIFHFLFSAIQLSLVGCAIGYLSGILFDDDNIARGFVMMFALIFMLVSGGLNNAANYPPVVDQMQYISPNRYALENFFRTITTDMKYDRLLSPIINEDSILENLGFTRGYLQCHFFMGVLFLFFYALGWVAIVVRNWKY